MTRPEPEGSGLFFCHFIEKILFLPRNIIFSAMSYEYTVTIPESGRSSFRALARELGWKVTPKKMSPYERSKMEARTGQVHSFDSLDKMFASLEK